MGSFIGGLSLFALIVMIGYYFGYRSGIRKYPPIDEDGDGTLPVEWLLYNTYFLPPSNSIVMVKAISLRDNHFRKGFAEFTGNSYKISSLQGVDKSRYSEYKIYYWLPIPSQRGVNEVEIMGIHLKLMREKLENV